MKNSGACADMDSLKAYIDANQKEILDKLTPALPTPTSIEVSSKFKGVRKEVKLHYVCSVTRVEVVCKSSDWSTWMKAGATLVQAGVCVVEGNAAGAAGAGAKGLLEAYSAYKEGDHEKQGKTLETEIKERGPFLTSAEQDKLVKELRKEKFFDKMKWDGAGNRWVAIKARV